MVRMLFFSLIFFILHACSDDSGRLAKLESRVAELEKKADDSYRPGFGEFMGNIQVHHAKLWFAGTNGNWALADFEVSEIRETLDNLKKYQAARVETQSLPMIEPVLDGVADAIKKKDKKDFKQLFTTLTETCNQCHRAVNYPFNDVKIPDHPPFGNQVFRIEDK